MTRGADIMVASCGNRDAGDDAFGPTVARALRQGDFTPPVSGIALVELDLNPGELLNHLPCRALLLVDAVYAPGRDAGELLDQPWNDRLKVRLAHDDPLSSHGLSVASQVALAQRLGLLPDHVRLIAATLSATTLGAPMSDAVRRLVPAAVERIGYWVERWSAATASGGAR